MTDWQPNWTTLETTAASLVASDPLAALITTVTPLGGYVEIGLRAALSDVVATATKQGPLSGPLVIAVDTLDVAAGDTVIPAPGVSIVARTVLVDSGPATLVIRSDNPGEGVQLTTAEISGSLSVVFETAAGAPLGGAGGGALALSGLNTPQSITAVPGSAPVATTDQLAIADELHEPWSVVALELSSATAATLIDQGSAGALGLAAEMLGWVIGGCSALLANQSQFPTVDFATIASLQTSSVGLLSFAQSQTSGATYVPVLSSNVYEQQIDALLQLAAVYDGKIEAFQSQQNLEQLLSSFAGTLSTTYQQAETPLLNALNRLADEAGSVESQLTNAAVQLQTVGATLAPLQQALVDAIDEEFQQELVKAAVETFITVLTLYIGAAAAVLGDPEVLAGTATAVIKTAAEQATKLIEAGQKTINEAISNGVDAANLPPAPDTSAATAEGAQYLAGSMASFGSASALLWAVVSEAFTSKPPNLSPNLVSAVDQLPDLSGFSVGGVDPTTYWNAVVAQTTAAVEPHKNLSQATAYLEAVQLAATYGSAVGDLQWKLLELYTQGMAAFDQLVAADEAQRSWESLQKSLTTAADQAAAAVGLLQRGYLNVKRSLVLAVENYRAAFLYQWLQPASIEVDVSMDLVTLQQQATNSITGLNEVLAGQQSGPVQPRQPFQHVTYTVSQDELFAQVDENGQAQFTIDPAPLAAQLGGDTALYLTAATFQLEGDNDSGEVELKIATSGHYMNQLGSTVYRFVSKPVSMTNNYLPGNPPTFVTQWQFADAASYLAPTPYTNWSVTVNQGDWQHATGIKIELAGILLQNP